MLSSSFEHLKVSVNLENNELFSLNKIKLVSESIVEIINTPVFLYLLFKAVLDFGIFRIAFLDYFT